MGLMTDILNLPLPGKKEANSSESLKMNPSRCGSYEYFMHQLSSEEIDLLYTVYHRDFKILGYKPFD